MTSQKTQVKLTDIIAPNFYPIHWDLYERRHTYYRLSGGRGSTKSSFVSVEIVLGMMQDALEGKHTSAVCFRRYANNLQYSVYEQILWAIDRLGVSHLWHTTLSPLRLIYKPTDQAILFRGADKVKKAKSIKVRKGYIKYLWLEELDEFEGAEKLRSIEQSVVRGGPEFAVFYTYNPPKSQRNWVNDPAQWDRPDVLSHKSDYRSVPAEWLGKEFINGAEHLKATKPDLYRHEYLGEVTGTGAEVFANLTRRKISDEEIASFDRIRRGLDFGYSIDPLHYTVCHYDKTRRRLYVFFEIHKVRMSNRAVAALIMAENTLRTEVICDSAEPKSIDELREYGVRVRGARKGPGSVEHGVKWLSEELEEIVIDSERCPNTWREFFEYELARDANGNFKAGYPDKDNHSVDALRYALIDDIRAGGAKFVDVEI